ncbi:MAG: aminopeptidase [Clostridia bacterium]|nr:aminopeptidase [Clostridia bacterium]
MDKKLKQYAELVVRQGVNLAKGEMLTIASPIIAADLVEEITEAAYKAGARKVMVLWRHDKLSRLGYLYQDEATLTEVPDWVVASRDYIIDNKSAYVNIISDDPDIMNGIDAELITKVGRASSKALTRFRESTSTNTTRWCLVAYPQEAWAKQIFPDLEPQAALEKLWDHVQRTMRLDTPDPIAAWKEHENNLKKRSDILNNAKIVKFHYKNSIGTDFSIGMPKGYIFTGAVELSSTGVPFTANMPTEEVFSTPDRMTAEGTLVSALPLVHGGKIVDKFSLTFKNGRIVDYKAEVGQDVLKGIIETDEGAHYLGEIALVGYNSPIQNLKTLFYKTLFDENASCHFAIGRGFPACYTNGLNMTKDELLEKGINNSLEHVDFMVGTADLSITATTEDGKEMVIFKDGDWTF